MSSKKGSPFVGEFFFVVFNLSHTLGNLDVVGCPAIV
jgi:hypothetical protein